MTGSRQLTLLTTLSNEKGRGLHPVEEKWLLTHLLTLFSKILCFQNQPASATIFRLINWRSLAPDLRSAKKYSPVIFVRLAFVRQNFHKSWRRKSLAIE